MSELTADEVAKIERALRARAARNWPPYNPDAKCPKCSYDDIGSLYHDGWVYRFPRSGDAEWIERTCRRCHYCWPEECVPT